MPPLDPSRSCVSSLSFSKPLPHNATPSLQRLVNPAHLAWSSSSSISEVPGSNSSSVGSDARLRHLLNSHIATASSGDHRPVAVEHRWPEGPSIRGNRAHGVFGGAAGSAVQRGGGTAANDPIIIDDPSPSSACRAQVDVQVVCLSSDDSD